MLALLSTVLPTMAPSSTVKRCPPFIWTHPSRDVPSNRSIHCSLRLVERGTPRDGGKANAMIESPDFVAFLPLPPAAMAPYCLPPTMYTLGVAYPPAGSWCSQSRRPELFSKARIFSSAVAATNTTPPAVATAPPKLSDPVLRIPFATRWGYSPSGTFQAISPLTRSTAFSVPQGGEMAGTPSGPTNNG